MNDKAQAAAPSGDESAKETIYEKVAAFVQEKTGKRIGKSGGRHIFDMITEEVFALATREGSMRFNGGFGSLHVRKYKAGERRLPSGAQTKFGERQKLRYEEGVVVKALVANAGDLTTALQVRGTRAKADGAAPAAAEKGGKKAKSAPATAPTTKAAEAGESVDLD